jgi:hypothetical protein
MTPMLAEYSWYALGALSLALIFVGALVLKAVFAKAAGKGWSL